MEKCLLKTYRRGWEMGLRSRDRHHPHQARRQVKASPLHRYYVAANTSVFAGTEGQEGQASEADMLVLGFQEIDHSTEAFFNFPGRAKEDAWTTAILAALGDKAERYEKVNLLMATVGTCS